jgi:hypothetical protein
MVARPRDREALSWRVDCGPGKKSGHQHGWPRVYKEKVCPPSIEVASLSGVTGRPPPRALSELLQRPMFHNRRDSPGSIGPRGYD